MKTQFAILSAVVCLGLLLAPLSHAGPYIQESIDIAIFDNNEGHPTDSVADASGHDHEFLGTAGWTLLGGALIGATVNFNTASMELENATTPAKQTLSGNQIGPAIGFVGQGFHVIGTYVVTGSRTEETTLGSATEKTKDKDASGYQLDVGYGFGIGPALKIGPSLVYRSIEFKKRSFTNSADPTENYTDRDLATKAKLSGLTAMITVSLSI
ncbi:MAG: hypothetical protein NDJ90_15340 [Oligoflexia bacterium]|nr:hypothetical protein [Oligoflexia bacterium]